MVQSLFVFIFHLGDQEAGSTPACIYKPEALCQSEVLPGKPCSSKQNNTSRSRVISCKGLFYMICTIGCIHTSIYMYIMAILV